MTEEIEIIFTHVSDSGVDGALGIGKDGRLYWNGRVLVTEQRVSLAWWVNFSVVVGGLSTFVIALFTVLLYLRTPG